MKNSSAATLSPVTTRSRKAQKRERGHCLKEGMDVKIIPRTQNKDQAMFGSIIFYAEGKGEAHDEIVIALTPESKIVCGKNMLHVAHFRNQKVWKEVANSSVDVAKKTYAEGHPGYRIKKQS